MAPQLGMGTFRIRTIPGGPNDSYAWAPNNNTEIWAMRRADFVKPNAGGPTVTIEIEPIDPLQPDFCTYLAIHGGHTVFEIIEHTKTPGCAHILLARKA
jgi:hypothetical protein